MGHTQDLFKVVKTAERAWRERRTGHSRAAASSPLLLLSPANTYLPFCDLISSSHKCQAVQVWASKGAPDCDAIHQSYLVQLNFWNISTRYVKTTILPACKRTFFLHLLNLQNNWIDNHRLCQTEENLNYKYQHPASQVIINYLIMKQIVNSRISFRMKKASPVSRAWEVLWESSLA